MLVAVGSPVARRNSAIASRQDMAGVPHQAYGVLEEPRSVRVEDDASLRKARVEGGHRGDFVLAAQHPAL
jgi:hypothetical protein